MSRLNDIRLLLNGWRRLGGGPICLCSALAVALSVSGAAQSHARIVHVTLVSGGVELRLPDGLGWRPALASLPMTEGGALRTAESGVAEVQLECGSVLRLDHASEFDFTTLSLDAGGHRDTALNLARGSAYLSLHNHDGDALTLNLGADRLTATRQPLRLTVETDDRLTVWEGAAELKLAASHLALNKDESVRLSGDQPAVVRAPPADKWTQWNFVRDEPRGLNLASGFGRRGGNRGGNGGAYGGDNRDDGDDRDWGTRPDPRAFNPSIDPRLGAGDACNSANPSAAKDAISH